METRRELILSGWREGEPEVRCFALDGQPLWFRKDARLLAILPGDRVLIAESDEVLIRLSGGLRSDDPSPSLMAGERCFSPRSVDWRRFLLG